MSIKTAEFARQLKILFDEHNADIGLDFDIDGVAFMLEVDGEKEALKVECDSLIESIEEHFPLPDEEVSNATQKVGYVTEHGSIDELFRHIGR